MHVMCLHMSFCSSAEEGLGWIITLGDLTPRESSPELSPRDHSKPQVLTMVLPLTYSTRNCRSQPGNMEMT